MFKFKINDTKRKKNNFNKPVVDQYNKFIKLYQDGELIDEMEFEGRLLPYHKEKTMYLR